MVSRIQKIKYFVQFVFFIFLFHFSYSSFKHFIRGSVVYETKYNFDNEDVPFPSLTLCPALKTNNLVNLKINKIAKDFNLQENSIQSFNIYGTLKRINTSFMEIVRNYSFTYNEGFYIDHMVTFAFGQRSEIRNDSNNLM